MYLCVCLSMRYPCICDCMLYLAELSIDKKRLTHSVIYYNCLGKEKTQAFVWKKAYFVWLHSKSKKIKLFTHHMYTQIIMWTIYSPLWYTACWGFRHITIIIICAKLFGEFEFPGKNEILVSNWSNKPYCWNYKCNTT